MESSGDRKRKREARVGGEMKISAFRAPGRRQGTLDYLPKCVYFNDWVRVEVGS